MTRNRWLILSVGLNLVLAAVIVRVAVGFDSHNAATQPSGEVDARITNRAIRVNYVTNEAAPMIAEVEAAFRWAELESPDYRIYIANLRALGCPEPTIRDIIESELDALYGERVKQIVDEVTGRFWEFMTNMGEFEPLVEEKLRQLEALRTERQELLALLLGNDETHTRALTDLRRAEKLAEWEWRLDFLPPEKVLAVHQAHQRCETATAEAENSQAGLSEEERRNRIRELNAIRDRELEAALTPEEFAEFKFRSLNPGEVLDLTVNLEVTEEEVRQLARARFGSRGAEREEQIAQLLGPDRYSTYQRETDQRFRDTSRITERFNLPAETAVNIFEMQKEAESLVQQVRADPNRSSEERAIVLEALHAEMTSSLATVLGPTAFKAYQRYNGRWLSALKTR